MAFDNMPARFSVRAEIVKNRLRLQSGAIAVRYWGEADSEYPLRIVRAHRRNGEAVDSQFWELRTIGASGPMRLEKLTFRGAEFIEYLEQLEQQCVDPENVPEQLRRARALYDAFASEERIQLYVTEDPPRPATMDCGEADQPSSNRAAPQSAQPEYESIAPLILELRYTTAPAKAGSKAAQAPEASPRDSYVTQLASGGGPPRESIG